MDIQGNEQLNNLQKAFKGLSKLINPDILLNLYFSLLYIYRKIPPSSSDQIRKKLKEFIKRIKQEDKISLYYEKENIWKNIQNLESIFFILNPKIEFLHVIYLNFF